MADERRIERVEDRLSAVEQREAGRDVKVDLMTSATNRLAVLVGSSGIAILGAVVAFILTGGQG